MKKSTSFLSVVLVALALVPRIVFADDCDFTPNLFPGQPADRTSFEVSATVAVGDYGLYDMHVHSQVSNLTSTDQLVVKTHNENGYDGVFFTGVGTADVTYTENWFTSEEGGAGDGGVAGGTSTCSTDHIIHYTVEQGTPVAYYELNREPVTECRATPNGYNLPYLVIIVKEVVEANGLPMMQERYINDSQCTVTSSNEDVATIGRGNTVMPTGTLGETTITATWPGTVNWKGVTVSYKLKVEEPKQSVIISFSQTEYTDTIGRTMYPPTPLIVPSTAAISRWVSSEPTVASVDEKTGVVTMLAAGDTRISAWVDEDDTYYSAQGWYSLKVVKKNPQLSFDATDVEAEPGVPFTPPTFHNPFNVPINKWNSQNPDVADVSEDGKTVTIKKEGDALIFCESYSTDEYAAQSVSYIVHVRTIGITVKGVAVTSLNAADVLGDGKVRFDKPTRTLHLNEWISDVKGLNYEIQNGVIKDERQEALTIMLHGNCAIVNAVRAILAENGAVLLRSESKKDTLTLLASEIAVNTQAFKIHECALYASGNLAGMKLAGELSVSKGSHVYAEGGVAIECDNLIMADGEAGIEILTPDVRFEPKKGFLTKDNQPAKAVEIGKVPVVVADDEVTTIEFTQQDPDGNESVLFTSSVNDIFNEETGQIEISTSLTDEQVAEALETLVPGSSAWTELLPGSLTFDIPAGKGEILIECLTLPGYTLQVKLDGKAVVSLTQVSLGWAKVTYDVEAPTHVVIYLHAESSSLAPARIGFSVKDNEPATGAFIESIKIIPNNAPVQTFTVTALSADESMGQVTGSGAFNAGAQAELTATPAEGFEFVRWNDGNTDNPRIIIVAEDVTFTAEFQQISQGFEDIEGQKSAVSARKTLIDGHIFILMPDGKRYDATGRKQ